MSKIALVTGASKGIGRALVEDLTRRGWQVIGVARSKEKLKDLEEEFGDRFIPVACDVAKHDEVARISQKLIEEEKIPSLFFLNAGVAGEVACETPNCFTLTKHEEVFDVNYFGVLSWVEAWIPVCKQQYTTFVVTSSVNAIFAPPTGSAYAASKAAIAKAFEGLALTYYQSNLRFAVVYPGPVATEGLKGNVPFVWSAERMAKYMVSKVLKGKTHIENSIFYSLFTRLLRFLPRSFVMRILGHNN
jgi:3-hydroxy acid dehydrogenase/malonic semialdehyde reductase